MSTSDGWIKMTERKPEADGKAIWLYFGGGSDACELIRIYHGYSGEATHWKPAALPAPPKKELTQREKDEEVYQQWLKDAGVPYWKDDASDAWHAALAYRDGQNREDLEGVPYGIECGSRNKVLNLRRRAGLDT